MADQALAGLRVMDLTLSWAGPFCTRFFSTMGAEVIRVDNPNLAPGRPFLMSSYVNDHNINKLSAPLNLATPRGVGLFKQLVAISDIVVENFSARVMAQLGLDYDVLHTIRPDIIMLSMPGFGQNGPYRDHLSYGTTLEAMVGLSQLTGYQDGPPLRVGMAYPDPVAGLTGAFAILAALNHRRRTGKGQHIELSQLESATGLMHEAILDYTMNGRVPTRQGNRDRSMAPHQVYPCRGNDSWIAIAVSNDAEWRALCEVMDRSDLAQDPRFADLLSRYEHQNELDAIISGWTRGFDHDELAAGLQAVGVPAGPLLTSRELVADRHLAARRFFTLVDDPVDGPRPIPGPSARLSRTPGGITSPSPVLGQHQNFVLDTLLGLPPGAREEMIAEGVTLRYPPPGLKERVPPAVVTR